MFQLSRCRTKTGHLVAEDASLRQMTSDSSCLRQDLPALKQKTKESDDPTAPASWIRPLGALETQKPGLFTDSDDDDETDNSSVERRQQAIKQSEKEKLRQTLQTAKTCLIDPALVHSTAAAGTTEENSHNRSTTPLRSIVQDCLREIPDPKQVTVGHVMRKIASRLNLSELTPELKASAKTLLIEMLQKNRTTKPYSSSSDVKTMCGRHLPPCNNFTEASRSNIRSTTDLPVSTNNVLEARSTELMKSAEINHTHRNLQPRTIQRHMKMVVAQETPSGTAPISVARRIPVPSLESVTTTCDSNMGIPAKDVASAPTATTKPIATDMAFTSDENVSQTSFLALTTQQVPPKTTTATNGCTIVLVTTASPPVVIHAPASGLSRPVSEAHHNTMKANGAALQNQNGNITIVSETTKSRKRNHPMNELDKESSLVTNNTRKAVKKPRAKANTTPTRESSEQYECDQTDPPKSSRRKTAPMKRCRWCNQCSCQAPKVPPRTLGTMSSSAVEKALIKRLTHLESTADHYEAQTEAVRRQLQKHRRSLYQRRAALLKQTNTNGITDREQRQIFILPDVDVLEQKFLNAAAVNSSRRKAPETVKERLFAATAAPQRTLTQLVGDQDSQMDDGGEPEPCACVKEDVTDKLGEPVQGTTNEFVFSIEDEAAASSSAPQAQVERRDAQHYQSLWKAGRSGCFHTEWDEIFIQHLDCGTTGKESDDAMEHLVELFGYSPKTPEKRSLVQNDDTSNNSIIGQLSARGKGLADQLVDEVANNVAAMAAVAAACPEWKENIQYAMAQRESEHLENALENVRDAQKRLAQQRTRIMDVLEQRTLTLSLFETTLERSLGRLDDSRRL